MIADVLRNINLFVDARGYAGKVSELTPPKLTMKVEELMAGGLDAPVEIDMGIEKLEAQIKLNAVDPDIVRGWGFRTGGNLLSLLFRGALQGQDGTVNAVAIEMRGQMREVDWGAWKPGEAAEMTGTMAVRYYKYTYAGEDLIEIDVDNMVRIVNGTDQLAEMRAAIGV